MEKSDKATSLSIVVPTKGRVESLRRLLDSLCRVDGRDSIDHEIIVANNAPDEPTARLVESLVHEYSRRGGARFLQVREPTPGRWAAVNKAIPLTQGALIGFLDDDVAVTPCWLTTVMNFFREHPFDAMQGAVLLPPEMENDPDFMLVHNRYRTMSLCRHGSKVVELKTLVSANMALKKEILLRVGLFDERLGAGRSGLSGDVEFAHRMLRGGGRIGYEPAAVVHHEVDWTRLTEEYFRLRHEQQGRSRLIYKKNSVFTIVPNLLRSVLSYGWYSLFGTERKQYRAKGRCYHYMAMLREKTSKMTGAQQ